MIDWSNISLKDLAGYVAEELRKKGIDTVLVGGACVSIYSKNRYQSYDLDYVTYHDMRQVKQALIELGFELKNKYYQHKDCQWFIEFVSPPIGVGDEPINKFNNVPTPFGTIKMLLPVDSVKDRLAGFYHWNDKQNLEQAIKICMEQKIDFSELERWSKNENQLPKFEIFLKLLKKNNLKIKKSTSKEDKPL